MLLLHGRDTRSIRSRKDLIQSNKATFSVAFKGTTLVRVRRSLERARELIWTAPFTNMEFPLEIQALINLFAKPITSGKWREGSFIIDSFRAAAAEYIEQRYEYDDLNQFMKQLHGFSYRNTYSQLPFYEWLALSHPRPT